MVDRIGLLKELRREFRNQRESTLSYCRELLGKERVNVDMLLGEVIRVHGVGEKISAMDEAILDLELTMLREPRSGDVVDGWTWRLSLGGYGWHQGHMAIWQEGNVWKKTAHQEDFQSAEEAMRPKEDDEVIGVD